MALSQLHEPCVFCGRPAVELLSCWNCGGKGELIRDEAIFMPGKMFTRCRTCEGSGKLPYCEKCAPKKRSELIRLGIIKSIEGKEVP